MNVRWLIGLILMALICVGSVLAQESKERLTLEESIRMALERSLTLHAAMEGVVGSEFRRRAAMTDFFPKWTGEYSATKYSYPAFIGHLGGGAAGVVRQTSEDVFNFNTTINQPLFAGGAISANYRVENLGVDISKTDVETAKRDLVLRVREAYFSILAAEKLVEVGKQAVKQFEAQLEVAKAFFEVGIVPKNDVLQAEVRLANARQALVKVENALALAKSSFNTVLRRDINAPVNIVDILEYKPFPFRLEETLEEALNQRPEIKIADLKVKQARENVKIARSPLFPIVSVAGNYSRTSDELTLQGDMRSDQWLVQTLATFTIGDWGKTAYRLGESKVRVTQAEDGKMEVKEAIVLEVKQSFLNVLEAEKNITVAEKSIEQAEENLRMNEERYKYQVATSTDVLDAVTLLAQARVNYYSALTDFNIAKARLERAMGRMYPPTK